MVCLFCLFIWLVVCNVCFCWSRRVRCNHSANRVCVNDIASDRISHYLGNGLLVFSTRGNGLEELFIEDSEMLFFAEKEELLEKIRYVAAHDDIRKSIAHAGWQKAHEYYNERLVARYIIETLFGYDYTHDYAWPTTRY